MARSRGSAALGLPPIEAAVRAGLISEIALTGSRGRPGPLVLVAAPQSQRLLDDIVAAFAAADPGGVIVEDGVDLGVDLVAVDDSSRGDWLRRRFAVARTIVIRNIDRISAPVSQAACGVLLDHAAAAGRFVCVSLATPPPRAGLVAALESRLVAGLVVPLPPAGGGATVPQTTAAVSVARVIRATARQRGIEAETLLGHGRRRTVAEVRGLAMYLVRQLTGRSLGAIGRAFGGRDHTTVLRSIRGIRARMRTDAAFAGDVERLAAQIGSRPAGRRRPAG